MIISCNKKNLNRSGSYIDSPDWIKNKIVTTNSINKKDSEYFHYANKVTLNHEEIGKHSQRITKIKPVIDQYNSERIHYPSKKKNKMIRKKLTIAPNVLYAKKKNIYIYPAYVSKHKSYRKKQVILLMIRNGEGSHCIGVKNYFHYKDE